MLFSTVATSVYIPTNSVGGRKLNFKQTGGRYMVNWCMEMGTDLTILNQDNLLSHLH